MLKGRILLLVLLTLTLVLAGCVEGEEKPVQPSPEAPPAPSPSAIAQDLSGQIAAINPAQNTALASLLQVSNELVSAQEEGTVTQEEGDELAEDLEGKFSQHIRHLVDEIDPTDLGALNDFWALQRVQKLDEYEEHCSTDTHEYKEEQMGEKFNDYIRNWVDQIDPSAADGLQDIFFLQKIQHCQKYSDLATPDTHRYKEEQMGEKFNEWVRNDLDNLDPTNPDDVSEMVFLQKLQHSKKWDEYATPETEQYKKATLKEKFNEWVRERVDELDPSDPNYEEELQKLLVLQRIDKYKELATPETHEYKEKELSQKMDEYATSLVNQLVGIFPISISDFLSELLGLRTLQGTEIYQGFCSERVNNYVEDQLALVLYDPEAAVLPPQIIGTLPEDGQENVRLDQPVLIAFTQPMEPALAEVKVWPEIEYEIIGIEDNVILALYSLESWQADTDYTVYIGTGTSSASGITLENEYEFEFSTKEPGEAPQVVETSPRDGQVDAWAVGKPIAVTFNQPVDPTSVEAALAISPSIDYSIYWEGDNTIAVLQPLASLEFNTSYTVKIGTEAVSTNGVSLETDYSFDFTTGLLPPPTVSGTMPFDGQTGIPLNYPIQIMFDQPMEPASVEAALTISPAIDYSTEWLEADFVLIINPTSPLLANTTYTISIEVGTMSSDGVMSQQGHDYTFKTGAKLP